MNYESIYLADICRSGLIRKATAHQETEAERDRKSEEHEDGMKMNCGEVNGVRRGGRCIDYQLSRVRPQKPNICQINPAK